MKFNLNDLNPPAWFNFDDNNPEDGSVLVRVCSGNDLEDINRKTSRKQPPQYKRGVRYEIPDEINEKKRTTMLWDFIIVDWKGVLDQNGKPLECTTDNKVKLMRESVKFATFVGNCIEKLSEDIGAYQDDVEKNSLSSQPD